MIENDEDSLGPLVQNAFDEQKAKLRQAAERGDAFAQRSLGVMYEIGRGVPQDYAEAGRWYRLAAEQGNAFAQRSLGVMYKNGQGVPQDFAEAVRWYRLAAEQGDAFAQRAMDQLNDSVENDQKFPLDRQNLAKQTPEHSYMQDPSSSVAIEAASDQSLHLKSTPVTSNSNRIGWVYILSHEHYGDKVKIGFTERTVEERIAELEAGTGAPRGIIINYAIATSNPRLLESKVHARLAAKRTWKDKDFFSVSSQDAAAMLITTADAEGMKIFDQIDSTLAIRFKRGEKELEEKIKKEVKQNKTFEEKVKRSKLSNEELFLEEIMPIKSSFEHKLRLLDKYESLKNNDLAYVLGFVGVFVGLSIEPRLWSAVIGGGICALIGGIVSKNKHPSMMEKRKVERLKIMQQYNNLRKTVASRYNVKASLHEEKTSLERL